MNPIMSLTDKNYATWRVQMKMSLIRDDLFNIVNGTEVSPTEVSAQIKFNRRRDRALAMIVLSIEPKLLYLIGDPTDPHVVWDKLSSIFQAKSWSNKLRLKRSLYNLRLEPTGNLQEHLKHLIEIFDELAVIGEPIKDEDRVICLLASLPETFSTLVTALEASENVPSWDCVVERLLHQNNKNVEKEDCSENKSFFTKRNNSAPNRPNHKMNKVNCHECGKMGHIRKNCYKYLARIKGEKSKKNGQNLNVKCDDVMLYASTFSVEDANTSLKNLWIIDSGCTQHMTNDEKLFVKFEKCGNFKVQIGDGSPLNVEGKGNIILKNILPNNKTAECTLRDVLYVPGLMHNLLSVSQCTDAQKKVNFFGDSCKIVTKNGILIGYGNKIGKLYVLNCQLKPQINSTLVGKDAQYLWHRRFCHLGFKNLEKLSKLNMVSGLNCSIKSENNYFCEHCCNGKNHRTPFPKSNFVKRKPFELIHTDVCGKMNPVSNGHAQYFITFIDEYSKYCWIYMLNSKDQVFEKFKEWKVEVENQFDAKIKILRSDNGGEYCSNLFENYLKSSGIIHQKTVPKTPEQNSVAERKNRTLVEATRCMISDSNLPKSFWAEAISTANYVINRSPSQALGNKTPFECLFKCKPNVGHFKVFGSKAFCHIPKDERKKLDFKSRPAIFLGYSDKIKGYRLYDLNTKRIFHSRDVIFDESKNSKIDESDQNKMSPVLIDNESWLKDDEIDKNVEYESDSDDYDSVDSDFASSPVLRRSGRMTRSPERYGEWCSNVQSDTVPVSVKEALNSSESAEWLQAMNSEMCSMKNNDVWNLVQPPPSANILKCKWLFKRKIDISGSISHKARLVAQGYSQKYGIDYQETYSPVVRFESVRALLAFAACKNMHIHHLDVATAFLNSKLDENIYMKQPEGFVISGKENYVCHLNKSIYGLKQSSMNWNRNFGNFLKNLGFSRSNNDSCIYIYFDKNVTCFIALYVDDLMVVCDSNDFLNDIKTKLKREYSMKDLGEIKQFLGIEINKKVNNIFISQCQFIEKLLKKFNFDVCKSVDTPVDLSQKLFIAHDKDELFDVDVYQSAVGALLYLSTRTRPDLCYAVSNVARFCTKPTKVHWQAIKRIFRYLRGTSNLGILYSNEYTGCFGYSDADWAGDLNDRKSTSGYCFYMNNAVISWKSNKQTCVALSTAEAEYVALSAATQEAIWLQKLFKELNLDQIEPLIINEDNQSAISMSKTIKDHGRGKHIDLKYHYVNDMINTGKIKLKYCPTTNMLADIFTKGLPKERFSRLRMMLGMKPAV